MRKLAVGTALTNMGQACLVAISQETLMLASNKWRPGAGCIQAEPCETGVSAVHGVEQQLNAAAADGHVF